MKLHQIIALTFVAIATCTSTRANTVTAATSYTQYISYDRLPTLGGSIGSGSSISGIGDTADVPLKRFGLILSFVTNDTWRSMALSPNSTISLRIRLNAVENGGASNLIHLASLDVGRDFNASSILMSWLSAPKYVNLGGVISPSLVGSDQTFDVTSLIRPHLSGMDFQKSAVCFGLFVPTPSDNQTRNLSFIDISSASLFVSGATSIAPQLSITNAICLEFTTTAGVTYYVEHSSNLIDWNRESVGIAGDGTAKKIYYSISQSRQFYRIVAQN